MNFEFIVYDREPDDIGILTINRPKVLNALNWQTLRELREFLEDVPSPCIAAINGYALGGGCELALSCDIRIASEKAKLGFPEVKLGIFPGWGGTQTVTRVLGLGRTKELVFTGEMIDANEALRIGLVEKVVPHEMVMEEARKLAHTIAKRGPIAVRLAKTAIGPL